MTILEEILAHKALEVAAAKRRVAPEHLAARAADCAHRLRSLRAALAEGPGVRVIAEIKRRSPSRGEIRADFDPVACARAYDGAGAAALSVLTDERYFGGRLDFLAAIREAVELPLLRKDFVIDPYQIDEARVAGADAVLLIVAALDPETLERLLRYAQGLGLEALVEVHDADELAVAASVRAPLIGINNRDLRRFETDLAVTERLAPRAPRGSLVVAESGIAGPDDVVRLEKAGARAFLVGESLMREPDPGAALARLRGTA